jgi:hypothetical protein
MQEQDATQLYTRFVVLALQNRAAYTVECGDNLVALYGPLGGALPLWPTRNDANFFISRHWPDLRLHRMTLNQLIIRLPIFSVELIPIGIGLADYPEALILPAMRLYDDLSARLVT